jgi:hypothetical protein
VILEVDADDEAFDHLLGECFDSFAFFCQPTTPAEVAVTAFVDGGVEGVDVGWLVNFASRREIWFLAIKVAAPSHSMD